MKTLLAIILLTTPAPAGDVYPPESGTKERTEILNAVRDPLEDIVQHSYLTSDVWWSCLHKELREPAAIFKLPESKI